MLIPVYKTGELAAFQWTDQVWRSSTLLAASDNGFPDRYLTMATPVVVGVVRRVRNARGVNTSLEDDDEVEHVTQSARLDPIQLDSSPKCEYAVLGRTADNRPITLRILEPGAPAGRQAIFTNKDDAERFKLVVSRRVRAVTPAVRADGLVWGPGTSDLEGTRITWTLDVPDPTVDERDWTQVNLGSLSVPETCGPSASTPTTSTGGK